MKTKVIFYHKKDSTDVFAYFPDEKYNDTPGLFTCYAAIGQHSACHINYLKECKLADPGAYQGLKTELTDEIGYDLDIINEKTFEYHREPTPYELKFGEGATHYWDFPFAEVCKIGLDFKTWIKADDGLRYYH